MMMKMVNVFFIICYVSLINIHWQYLSEWILVYVKVKQCNVFTYLQSSIDLISDIMALVGDSPLHVSYNKLLTTIETWGPKYVVSLEIFYHSWQDGFYNIFQFDTEDYSNVFGHREPSFHNDWGNRVSICATINDIPDFFWTDRVELGKWISVLITQTLHQVDIEM